MTDLLKCSLIFGFIAIITELLELGPWNLAWKWITTITAQYV